MADNRTVATTVSDINSTDFFTTVMPNSSYNDSVKCAMFDGDVYKCEVIIGVRRAFSCLSLVGCLFVIGMIWLFRKYAIFSQRLILYLSIAATFHVTFFIMGDMYEDSPFCTFEAWGTTFFSWTVLLWVCTITFNLLVCAVWLRSVENREWVCHLVCWVFPFLISLLPFIGSHYGPGGAWCWIEDNWGWRFGIWYFPLFVLIFLLFAAYIYIVIAVNRKVKTWEGLYDPDVERNKQLLKEDVRPLKWYPFVYLMCSLFPLINRIQNAASPNPNFGLTVMHAICSPLPGALNAVVFALDRETTSKLTWAQIKVAFMARFSRSPIREYPVVQTTGGATVPPPLDTDAKAPINQSLTNENSPLQ